MRYAVRKYAFSFDFLNIIVVFGTPGSIQYAILQVCDGQCAMYSMQLWNVECAMPSAICDVQYTICNIVNNMVSLVGYAGEERMCMWWCCPFSTCSHSAMYDIVNTYRPRIGASFGMS